MADVDLAEDAVAVVGDDDAAHGIEEHFEHGAGAEGRPDDVGHGPGGGYVGQLGLAAGLALRFGVCLSEGLWREGDNNLMLVVMTVQQRYGRESTSQELIEIIHG